MNRLLSVITVVVFLVVSAAATILYLAYGLDREYPAEVTLEGVDARAEIRWLDEYTYIQADDDSSLYASLGFVHGARRTWSIHLFRQAALGRLADWYGAESIKLDSLTIQLGLAAAARESFRELPEEERLSLTAYSEGVNTAMSLRSTRLRDEFALLRITPEPWEPWHALAVERLAAWLAAPPLPDSTLATAPSFVAEFARRSETLRDFLALHDLDQSSVWVTDDGSPTLAVRYVYGASAAPLFVEHLVDGPGGPRRLALLPGTPFPFLSVGAERAIAVLPGSTISVAPAVVDTGQMRQTHTRITDRQGREQIVSSRWIHDRLMLGIESATTIPMRPDTLDGDTTATRSDRVRTTAWLLSWSGFHEPSDAASFRAVMDGNEPSFQLFSDRWAMVDRGGRIEFTASDGIIRRPLVSVLGHPTWAPFLADRLEALMQDDGDRPPGSPFEDVYSAWAEGLTPSLIASVSGIPDTPSSIVEALTYVRNWTYEYSEASIAASIFDRWMSIYRDSTGHLPEVGAADTLFSERFLRYRTLQRAVDELGQRLGTDMSQWRWEETQGDWRHVPGWPPSDTAMRDRPNRRYDPIEVIGRGHPSTIDYGRSYLNDGPPGAATWEAFAPLDALDSLSVRRRRFEVYSFRDRYMVPEREPAFFRLRAAETDRATVIRPADKP